MRKLCFFFCIFLVVLACQKPAAPLTAEQKNQLVDSAKAVVRQVVDLSNKLDFKTVFTLYSTDADARFVENGRLFSSLDSMKAEYDAIVPSLELLQNSVDQWYTVVLSSEAVSVTLPMHFKIKAKGLSEYNGQYVWSGIVRKENGKWMIFQSHESWLNFAEAMAALMPPKTETKK